MKRRAIGYLVIGVFCAASATLPGPVWGQSGSSRPVVALESKPIGKVQSITGPVVIEHTRAVVLQASAPAIGGQAKVDDPVYLGDVIRTQAGGTAGIIFGDGTSFNISQNARMEINEFVYDPKSTSNSTLFNLTRGTFTFLAGKTAKTGNMRVETPVGTMGIRGTAPHVEILDDGTVKFTTLIEEYKNTAAPAAGPGGRQRSARNPTQPDPATRGRSDKDVKKMLEICRGC
jgi:hypothetical protein